MVKKVLSYLLCVAIIFSFVTVNAENEVRLSKAYENQDYVVINGCTSLDNAGFNADILLVKKEADLENLTDSDIGYIAQTKIAEDGSYSFEFGFSGFEYNSNKEVDNYEVVLNINGVNANTTITKAETIKDFVSFDIDYNNFGRAIANITNEYDLKDISYTMILGFYDASGKLLDVKMQKKYLGADNSFTYSYNDVPSQTTRSKCFVWDSTAYLIPLASSESFDITANTENREVMMLTIAPGIDETERNFAWYDVPGIEGARIQYAEKTSETDVTTFPEDRAITIQGTCGRVDVDDCIGVKYGSLTFSHDTEYSWGKATISGLEKGKSYVYRIGDKFGWCKGIYEFTTEASPEDGFSFIVLNDEHAHYNTTGRTGYMIESAREVALDTVPDASMVLALGDNVDYPWFENAYEDYFDREGMTSIPLASVSGSTHDFLIGVPGASLFGYHFNMPNQSDSGYLENVGGNYWYTYGDVLFIGVMHNLPENLESTKAHIKSACQANPDAKWKIVLAHIPFGIDTESEGRAPSKYFTEDNADFIADNGIDLVLSAHTHVYARSKPMYNGKATDDVIENNTVTNPRGVTYFNFNTTGMLSGGYNHTYPDYIAKGDNVPLNPYSRNEDYPYGDYYYTHFSKAEVVTDNENAATLKITTYQNSHSLTAPHQVVKTEIIDTYTITKTK